MMEDWLKPYVYFFNHHFAHSMFVAFAQDEETSTFFCTPLLFGASHTVLVPKVKACNIVVKADLINLT